MTVAKFLACEARQELRYEFDGVQPVRMTANWIATALIDGDTLRTPEVDVEIPIDEFYAGLDYSSSAVAEPRA